jgi:hypothetical protein
VTIVSNRSTRRSRSFAGLLAIASAVALGGCAAAAPDAIDPSPTTVVSPAGGVALASLGFTHEPAERVWLPADVDVTAFVDQPNALVVTGDGSDAAQVEDFLAETLPDTGWTVTAEGEGGLIFESGEWNGAFAAGEDTWGLTVRNDEG